MLIYHPNQKQNVVNYSCIAVNLDVESIANAYLPRQTRLLCKVIQQNVLIVLETILMFIRRYGNLGTLLFPSLQL